MKKSLCLVFVVLLTSGSAFAAGGKLIFNLYGNCLDLPANNFTGQASQYKIYFEAKAAFAFSGNLYLWASGGYFPLRESWAGWSSKNVFTSDINVERKLGKKIMSGGIGFFAGYLEKDQLAVRTELGICAIANNIDSTTGDTGTNEFLHAETAKQSGIGVRGNLAFTYGIYKNIFTELSLGYMYAADTIDSVRTNLGGFHLQLGLGINL